MRAALTEESNARSTEPSPLNYMPLAFRRYEPMWPTWAIAAALALVAFFAALYVGAAGFGLITMAGLNFIFGAVSLICYLFDIAAECRIEGDCLSWRTCRQQTPMHLRIKDISRIVGLNRSDGVHSCEVVFDNGEHFIVNAGPLVKLAQSSLGYRARHKQFADAMRAVNPSVVFESRNGDYCHACGKRMRVNHFPENRCSECGVLKPKPLATS